MRKFLIVFVFSLIIKPVFSQTEEKKFAMDIYGFIRNDFYYDSRRNLETSNGLYYLMPLDKNVNSIGEDLNAVPSSQFLSISTRLGLNVKGPDVWNARTSAKIEGDFSGFSQNATMFRIRQAWVKLDWDKFDLLTGQTWHPMFGDVYPDVLALETGSPFQPFNRSPQIRFDYKLKSFRFYLSAIYQLQYTSAGPQGSSSDYLRDNILPELFLGADFKKGNWLVGAGMDFLRLRPRTTGTRIIGDTTITVRVNDNLSSLSFVAFAQYRKEKWSIKAKTIYGQNMSHLLLMSGYAVSETNNDGSYEYTNLNNSTSWLNITYGTKYQVGLFAGYSKNLGSSKELVSTDQIFVYGFKNLDQVYRISPQFSYNLKHWTFGAEYDLTTAYYGNLDPEDGKVKDTHDVTNHRIVGLIIYNF